MNERRAATLLTLAFVAVTAACGSSSSALVGGNNAPVASFTASPPSVPAGDNHQTVVTLDASASMDPDGDPLSYAWIVPNGVFVNNTGPTDRIAQVTFPGARPYTVTLTVDDGVGGSDFTNVVVQLN